MISIACESRMSSVSGLNESPQTAMIFPCRSQARVQVRMSDAPIAADARDDVEDIGADDFADLRDLVHERDLGREKTVGGVLDHLGRAYVGDDDLRIVERRVEIAHRPLDVGIGDAEDDAIGLHEIADRRPLAQKLGVTDDADFVFARLMFANDRRDEVARFHGDRGFVDDDERAVDRARDIACRGAHVLQIRMAVGALRRADRDERELRAGTALGDRRGKR